MIGWARDGKLGSFNSLNMLSHSEVIQYFRDYVTLWLKGGSGFGSMMHSSDCPLHVEFW